jgi:hypothetical protein
MAKRLRVAAMTDARRAAVSECGNLFVLLMASKLPASAELALLVLERLRMLVSGEAELPLWTDEHIQVILDAADTAERKARERGVRGGKGK